MFIDPGAIRQLINVSMNKTLKNPGISKEKNAGMTRGIKEKTVTIFESPAMSPRTQKRHANQSYDIPSVALASTASGDETALLKMNSI